MTKQERRRRIKEETKPAYDALMSCYPFSLEDLPCEKWKAISDKYQVSTFGRVKSFWRKEPRILKPTLDKDGYLNICLIVDNQKLTRHIHRLVATAFIPNPENKTQVNHVFGCKLNCHVSNLEWNTPAENRKHAFATGLQIALRGEDCPWAKLQNENIIYIRGNPDNLSRKGLAEKFDVCEGTISEIQLGQKWQNAGGTIRQSKAKRIPQELKKKIRADYATGNYTYVQLAEKYGLHKEAIGRIVREG